MVQTKQTLVKNYQAALDKLLIEQSKITSGSTSAAVDKAYSAAVKAHDIAIKAGVKVKDIPNITTAGLTGNDTKPKKTLTPEQQIKSEIDRASITDNNGIKQIQARYPNTLDEKGDATVLESYLYVEPANSKMRDLRPGSTAGQMGIQWGTNDTVRDLYKKQLLKVYGSEQSLYNKLYEAGYIKSKKMSPTTGARDVLNALQEAVADYSLTQVNDYNNFMNKI